MRIPSDPTKPSPVVDINAFRQGLHLDVLVAVTLLAEDVEREAPIAREVTPEIDVRIGLAGVKPIVPNGVDRHRVARSIPISGAQLKVIVRIEGEIPVRTQVRAARSRNAEESMSHLTVERTANEPVRRTERRRHDRQPFVAIVVLISEADLIESRALVIAANP